MTISSSNARGSAERRKGRRNEAKSQRNTRKSATRSRSLPQNYEAMKEQRSQSLQCLKEGPAKKALQLTLLKYFDSKP